MTFFYRHYRMIFQYFFLWKNEKLQTENLIHHTWVIFLVKFYFKLIFFSLLCLVTFLKVSSFSTEVTWHGKRNEKSHCKELSVEIYDSSQFITLIIEIYLDFSTFLNITFFLGFWSRQQLACLLESHSFFHLIFNILIAHRPLVVRFKRGIEIFNRTYLGENHNSFTLKLSSFSALFFLLFFSSLYNSTWMKIIPRAARVIFHELSLIILNFLLLLNGNILRFSVSAGILSHFLLFSKLWHCSSFLFFFCWFSPDKGNREETEEGD